MEFNDHFSLLKKLWEVGFYQCSLAGAVLPLRTFQQTPKPKLLALV